MPIIKNVVTPFVSKVVILIVKDVVIPLAHDYIKAYNDIGDDLNHLGSQINDNYQSFTKTVHDDYQSFYHSVNEDLQSFSHDASNGLQAVGSFVSRYHGCFVVALWVGATIVTAGVAGEVSEGLSAGAAATDALEPIMIDLGGKTATTVVAAAVSAGAYAEVLDVGHAAQSCVEEVTS